MHQATFSSVILGILVAVVPGLGRAASLYTEPFDGFSGWTATAGAAVAETGGAFRVVFPSSFPLPPASVLLMASNGASGGAFVGNFVETEARLIGFRFKADDTIPNSLLIELRSGAAAYSSPQLREQVTQTGIWCHVWAFLGGQGWIGDDSVITNVTVTVVYIRQSGSSSERYYVDDFFLDTFPIGESMIRGEQDSVSTTWTRLRPGWSYDVQACSDLKTVAWTSVATLAATSSVETLVFTNTAANASAFRLRH